MWKLGPLHDRGDLRFTPSLAGFLIVLGQLCLMGEIEINLSVDLSVELSAVLTIAGAVVFANRK